MSEHPDLTQFERDVLKVVKQGLNGMADSWNIAVLVRPKRWAECRMSHAGIVTAVGVAGAHLVDLGLVTRIPPEGRWDSPMWCAL